MDKATLFGVVLGLAVIFGAIVLSGQAADFWHLPAVLIVFGGTMAATFIKFPFRHVMSSFRVAVKTLYHQEDDPRALIERTKELAQVARKKGLLALEDEETPNEFYAKALQLSVDGFEPERIQHVLREDLELSLERHETGQKVFRSIGEQAPAFGMIGTLVGLVQMLGNLESPEAVGPGMAVALLTTLYGAIFAQLVALPIADNLEMRARSEHITRNLIVDAVNCIHQGFNSRMIEEMLLPYLPSKQREKAAEELEKQGQAEGQPQGSSS
ncbi:MULTISPECIES: motility protein A [unclassified Thioalkalivibrio]|uniref:motility protein A n=1 Tax=unclassified Thioalkalivibrio TaxID=2621013 RepID=UPI0003673F35|nr:MULTISPECIES: MotA/TolQ/ExbB proton channel family protein [unclassified Thioalkalivibrio]